MSRRKKAPVVELVQPGQAKAEGELIDYLEYLIAKARRGELVGLAFVGCWAQGSWNSGRLGSAADAQHLSHVILGASRLLHQANLAMDALWAARR
jgi:hypothetical protein